MLEGKLSISRTRSNRDDESCISITVTDELSRTRFLKIEISPEEFANAITNLGERPCMFELSAGLVGKRREHKTVVVPLKDPFKATADERLAAIAEYEVDGWIGYKPDANNHHNYSDKGVRVGFVRYISEDS